MSHTASRAVFRYSASKGSARLVLLAMADEASDAGQLFAYRRSHSHLARKANVDEGTVRKAIRVLEALGELVVVHQGNGRESSDYQLVLPDLDGIEGGPNAPPARANGAPRGGQTHPQGAPDTPPIIPLLPVDPPVHPSPTFDDFWKAYPPRGRKAEARAAWPAAVKAAGGAHVIVEAAQRYGADPNLPELQFVPHAVRWLKGERWTDPPLPPRAQQRNGRAAPRPIDTDRTAPGGVLHL